MCLPSTELGEHIPIFLYCSLSQKSRVSDLIVRSTSELLLSKELIKLGTSGSTFTHSSIQQSGLPLLETHPIFSGSGTQVFLNSTDI